MSLKNKMCVQFTIFEESIDTLERRIDICSILKSENLSFVVCELLSETNQNENMDKGLFAELSRRLSFCAKSVSLFPGTDSLYQQILNFGEFDCDELMKFSELFNWIHSSRLTRDRQSHAAISSTSPASSNIPCDSHMTTVNDVDNGSLNWDLSDVHGSTLNINSLDANEMSASMQAFINSMEVFFGNPPQANITPVSNSHQIGRIGDTNDNEDSVLSVINRIVDNVSPQEDTTCKGDVNSSFDGIMVICNDILTVSDTDRDDSRSGPPADDDDDDCFIDAASDIEVVEQDSGTHEIDMSAHAMPCNVDCSNAISATFLEQPNDTLLVEADETENGASTSTVCVPLRSSERTEENAHSVRSTAASFVIENEDDNADSGSKTEHEEFRGKSYRKKRKNFVTCTRIRGYIPCMFKGCGSLLLFRKTGKCWSHLFRHAESHIVKSCDYCDFKYTTMRKARSHHKSKHSDFIFRQEQSVFVSQQELNSIFEECFPGELKKRG